MREVNQPRRSDGRMRVLRIAHASLTPALRERERALAREYPDIDLEVVTTERWREAEVEVVATGDDLFPVTTARAWLSNHIQLFAYDPRPLVAALRRQQPDLIDLNHEPYSVACAEVLALCDWFAPQVPIVAQIAQNILRRYPPPFNWLQRRALRRMAAAYACSESTLEVLRAKGFDKPTSIVPFGVNTKAFQIRTTPNHEPNSPLTIGFVGRMLPGKGLNVLADALMKLAPGTWKLLLVGDGPEREVFARLLAVRGLLDRAQFVGAVAYDRVPELYQQMDLLVMPTQTTKRIREQFGRVLVEAMASGVPVVGSTCGAIPEVIADVGLVVPEGDAGALAGAMQRLLSDGALRERFRLAGRARAERHYSWERVADKTYDLFHQVLRGKTATVLRRNVEAAA